MISPLDLLRIFERKKKLSLHFVINCRCFATKPSDGDFDSTGKVLKLNFAIMLSVSKTLFFLDKFEYLKKRKKKYCCLDVFYIFILNFYFLDGEFPCQAFVTGK